jgi:hypothetical protein
MFLRLFAMAVLFGGVAAGCGGPRYVGLDSGPSDAAAPAGTLSLVSAPTLMLRPGQTASIDVRFTEAGGVLREGVVVSAAIEGTALDSTLGALSVATDASGIAHATLVAGTSASSFRVRLSAREASAAIYVDVGVGTSFGALLVHAPYSGTRPVTHRVIDVVPGATCAMLVTTPPTSGGRTVRSSADDVTITALPTTLTYAVLVRANGDLALEAQGCVDAIVPVADHTSPVTVSLVEVPLALAGGYDVDLALGADGWVEGRVQTWSTSLRSTVHDSGGDAALLLNAVEAELSRRGASADAAQLHALRSSSSLDAALTAQLVDDGTGPTEVFASLLDEAAVALDAPTVQLSLTIGTAGVGSMTTGAISCSDGRSGTVVLARTTPLVRTIMAMTPADGRLAFEGPVDAQVGALALAWVDAVSGDRAHVHGVAEVLRGLCTSFETFAATASGGTALSACDAMCRAAACTTTLSSLTTLVASGASIVDHDLDHVQISADLNARDDDGDARVDRLDGMVRGQLVASDGATFGPVDVVSGTLTGTRAAVP